MNTKATDLTQVETAFILLMAEKSDQFLNLELNILKGSRHQITVAYELSGELIEIGFVNKMDQYHAVADFMLNNEMYHLTPWKMEQIDKWSVDGGLQTLLEYYAYTISLRMDADGKGATNK